MGAILSVGLWAFIVIALLVKWSSRMKEWGFWEWVAYGVLLVAALIVAADTGFKTSPSLSHYLPEFIESAWWGFSPATLVVVGTVILILREFVFPKKATRIAIRPGDDAWQDSVPLEKIYGRTFVNETVELDGRHFVNPVFDNVTLFYRGTGPVFMENPAYVSDGGKMKSRLATRNKVVAMTLKIHHNLLQAAGVNASLLNLGPEAIFDTPKDAPATFEVHEAIHSRPPEHSDSNLQRVWGQTFKNQTVALDGFHYLHCTFDNVTFLYEGTASMGMTEVKFFGEIALGSTNESIKTVIRLADLFHRVAGGQSEIRAISLPSNRDLINPPAAPPPSPAPPASPAGTSP